MRATVRAALHAEATKVRTVAGPAWMLVAIATLTVGVSALAAAAVQFNPAADQDPVEISLTGTQLGHALVATLAVLVIGGEHSTGMLTATLAAVPRRSVVLLAKALVLAGMVLVPATVGVAGSLVAGRVLLAGNGFPALALTDGPVLRAAASAVATLVLVALLSLGLATAVRDSATAVGLTLGLLYLFRIAAATVVDPDWHRRLLDIAPTESGLTKLGLWSAGALLLGGLTLHWRDA